jgi:transketolase
MNTNLKLISSKIRGKIVELSHKAETPHLGSSLSCVDIIVSLYWKILKIDPKNPKDPNRDRFILSKGHAATSLYSVLVEKGFFTNELLDTYAKSGSCLAEQPSPGCAPGVEAATGSLGHGLSLGVGIAMAARIQKRDYRVFVLLSDGECNEGSVWEAAMFAPAQKLNKLCAIIDFNKWQATGRSTEVMSLNSLEEKFRAFGWDACSVDGHNYDQLLGALNRFPTNPTKPFAIIANTVKGKGVSFMEDDNNWHYRTPTAEELISAHKELGLIADGRGDSPNRSHTIGAIAPPHS